jgi:hypothetical protein
LNSILNKNTGHIRIISFFMQARMLTIKGYGIYGREAHNTSVFFLL